MGTNCLLTKKIQFKATVFDVDAACERGTGMELMVAKGASAVGLGKLTTLFEM